MPRALVVFESMFGNTESIATAVAGGLSAQLSVDVREVGVAPIALDDDLALLVVGAPTHAFGMSRVTTRADAATKTDNGLVSAGIGLRDWLAVVRPGQPHLPAAAFDTKVEKPRVPGSAAHAARRRLRRIGCRVVTRPETFYVTDVQGPLSAGELDRARRWGERLAGQIAAMPSQA